jgi:o-succinylbenzoate synthase
MRIKNIRPRELAMRLTTPFETSFAVMQQRRIILVEIETDDGSGWGEVTAGEGPFYNPECTDTSWLILRDFLSPRLLGRTFEDSESVTRAMAPVRGHEMTKAAIESAVWDILAHEQGMPLASLLGGTKREIACGVSLGIYAETSVLLDRIERELSAGYQRIKLKIRPGKDVAVVAAVRERYPDIALTVDANSAYTLTDIALLKQLDEFNLTYIEQPLEWNEIYQHAALQRQLKTPICLDECIHNLRDVQAAVQLGACKVINVKLGRVSGHGEARRIQQYCHERQIPVWCGGMLESGVGRAHNVAMSSLPGFSLPGDVSASQRYWEQDVIIPNVEVSSHGTIRIPDAAGIGFAVDRQFVEALTTRSEVWR